MKKVIIYSRFSPRPNADECRSIEKQVAKCKEYCKAYNYEILGVYEDEALSGGRADNRPQLQKALNACCKHKAILLVYSLSRLVRNTKDAITIAERLERSKANLISLSEQIDTTSAMGRAFFQIIAVLAELERELNSERTQAAMLYYQETGRRMSNIPPYGCVTDPDDASKLILNKQEQENIDVIVDLHQEGMSLREIIRQLESQGRKPRPKPVIDTKTGKYIPGRSGKYICEPGKWNHQLIKRILERYAS